MFQGIGNFFLTNWFSIIVIIAIVIFAVEQIRKRLGITRRPGLRIRIPRWLRWEWKKTKYWTGVAIFLIVFFGVRSVYMNWQDNRRATKAENRRVELAEAEARKWEVISQIPEKSQTTVRQVVEEKSPPPPAKNTGTVSKSLTCGEIAEIQTNKTDYNLFCDVGNPYCIQVSENGQTWHNVLSRASEPFRFSTPPKTLFIRYNGTDTAKIRLEYI